MEIIKYKTNLASIKDLTSDIDISDSKWNFLFDQNNDLVFFNGFRLLIDVDDKFLKLVGTYASSNLAIKDEYHNVFMAINAGTVLLSRFGIKELWDAYEYPSFVLLDKKSTIEEVSELCLNKVPAEQIVERIKGAVIIYKSFEPDVLWIAGDIEKYFNHQ